MDSQPLFYRLESATVRTSRSSSVVPARVRLSRFSVFIPGQILPLGEHQQSKNPRQKRPGLRRGAEDLLGSTRAGTSLDETQLRPFRSELSNAFQDIFNGSASNEPFFTSVASITVHVRDVDNRPPWFQPCSRTNLGTAKLCVSSGYRGRVNLTEKEVRASTPGRGPASPRPAEDLLLRSSAGWSAGAGAGPAVRQRRRQEQERADQLQNPARSEPPEGRRRVHAHAYVNLLLFLHPQGTREIFSRSTRTRET